MTTLDVRLRWSLTGGGRLREALSEVSLYILLSITLGNYIIFICILHDFLNIGLPVMYAFACGRLELDYSRMLLKILYHYSSYFTIC